MRAALIVLSLILPAWALPPHLTSPDTLHDNHQVVLQSDPSFDIDASGPARYDEDRVWRVDWSGLDDQSKRGMVSALDEKGLDIWRATTSSLDIRLPSHMSPSSLLPDIPHRLLIPDLQYVLDLSSPPAISMQDTWDLDTLDSTYHDSYHRLPDMYTFGDMLVGHFNGLRIGDGIIRMESFDVGLSYEGRAIRGFKTWFERGGRFRSPRKERTEKHADHRVGEESAGRMEILVQSGQHAREWVGPSTAMYFLHTLLVEATDPDSSSESVLINTDFLFTVVPTINPDGYVYSYEHSRMWRKNRQLVPTDGKKECIGIDLNANWGYGWSPFNKPAQCSDGYPGTAAFDAYETRVMADYIVGGTNDTAQTGRKIKAFVDLHSYGQLFMCPFAHTCEIVPRDYEFLMEAAYGVARAFKQEGGLDYAVGQACGMTYRAPGDAIDWVYGEQDVRWTYSAELRDTGTYGFVLPPSFIRPTGSEMSAGLMWLARFIHSVEVAQEHT